MQPYIYMYIYIWLWGNDWKLVRFSCFYTRVQHKDEKKTTLIHCIEYSLWWPRASLSIGHRNRWDDSQFACFKLFPNIQTIGEPLQHAREIQKGSMADRWQTRTRGLCIIHRRLPILTSIQVQRESNFWSSIIQQHMAFKLSTVSDVFVFIPMYRYDIAISLQRTNWLKVQYLLSPMAFRIWFSYSVPKDILGMLNRSIGFLILSYSGKLSLLLFST